MNWKAGDVAIVDNAANCEHAHWQGATITLGHFCGKHPNRLGMQGSDWWQCDGFCVREIVLRKPYDGHETCSWEDVVWCPAETVT